MPPRIYASRPPRIFLREWRKKIGISQERLGLRIGTDGVSGVTVGRWENWEEPEGREPDLNTLAAIAEALGIEIADLFRHPDQPSADELLRGQPQEVIEQAMKLIMAIRR
jgi:transcriptional regulator with XRE-family HTH domain